MHEVLVNRLGGLSLPRKSVVRLTDRPDMTLDVYRGRKTTMQQQQKILKNWLLKTDDPFMQVSFALYSGPKDPKYVAAKGSDPLTEVTT